MNESRSQRLQRLVSSSSRPYVLKNILENVPLDPDNGAEPVSITCVEHWNGHLYIGTSASEILHLVSCPGKDELDPSTFLLATRLQPGGHGVNKLPGQAPGVHRIVVLPGTMKACVLCNGVVSFYSLPELSPAYPIKDSPVVQWIGGLDENLDDNSNEAAVIMIALATNIQFLRVGDRLTRVKKIDFPGCLRFSRRETIACVADDKSYALLEVEHQQKIHLASIYSSQQQQDHGQAVSHPAQIEAGTGHNRSKSLGNFTTSHQRDSSSSRHVTQTLEPPNSKQRHRSPVSIGDDENRSGSRPRSSTDVSAPSAADLASRPVTSLPPHILSPSSEEFMFTTGTARNEPGVGVFVNLEGDVSRGTVEFDRYPESLLVCSFRNENNESSPSDDESLFILALLDKSDKFTTNKGVEIQDLSMKADADTSKIWLQFPEQSSIGRDGLHRCLGSFKHKFEEIAELLQSVRYTPPLPQQTFEPDPRTRASIERLEQETALFENQSPRNSSPSPEYEQQRTEEEKLFVSRLGHSTSQAVAWSGTDLWQILPNPLLLQLEHKLLQCGILHGDLHDFHSVDVSQLVSLLGGIRERDPQDETEYLTLNYIRQKVSMILFLYLQTTIRSEQNVQTLCKMVGNALENGQIDPRVVLLLVPPLAQEAVQGPNGIWLPQGIVDALMSFGSTIATFQDAGAEFWLMICQYLSAWQSKRGYGSISDEKFVFDSVDAGLLHTLLYLDQVLPEGSALQLSVRSQLNNAVDHWNGDFQRAIVLLEHYRRLFVLSRLYQSKRLAKDVLASWKRIIEGEKDEDRSLTIETVELQIKRYLKKIGSVNLVQEYGLWLARRNPALAVEVFADDESRIRLTPLQVVTMLKDQAPRAVQEYLEHLVFVKHLDQYADDLIGYYLDSVLDVLESSEDAKDSLAQSYSNYRALTSPKPTYLDFINQNAPPQSWWQSRLRLLQLLGSGGYATANSSQKDLTYSVERVLERLTPFSSFLVSESIILDARQGRHKEALRLLTHGLGDYDTAIRYCYFGGPAPTSSHPIDAELLPSRDVQQDLFAYLFHEFLRIDDVEERVERTSHLLGTFASWFDPVRIFDDIPEDWTVDLLAEFLVRTLRTARTELNQAMVVKALSSAQNLQKQVEFIELCEKLGSQLMIEDQDDAGAQDASATVK